MKISATKLVNELVIRNYRPITVSQQAAITAARSRCKYGEVKDLHGPRPEIGPMYAKRAGRRGVPLYGKMAA